MRTGGPTPSQTVQAADNASGPGIGISTAATNPDATVAVPFPEGSRPWWEEHFLHHWDARHGSARTAHVMDRLLAVLKAQTREFAFLSSRPLDVLDWGCAFGEGALRLAEALPMGSVTGLDVAEEAVQVARRRYPTLEFVRADDGRVPREFDVIVAADRLGHVVDPLATVRDHLKSCRWLYVALVPGFEEPLPGEPRARFDPTTLPPKLGGFTRLCCEWVVLDPGFGGGPRRLVVYASAAYLNAAGLGTEVDAESETETETARNVGAARTAPGAGGDSRLARALAESVARLAERESYWSARVEELRAEQERRSAAQAEREAALAAHESDLVARLDERGRLIDGLTAHITALTALNDHERLALEQAVNDLEARLAESQARVDELSRTSEARATELAALTAGRAWRLVQLASAARRKIAPRARAILPLPEPVRQSTQALRPGRKAV
jgi:hypothetical protein